MKNIFGKISIFLLVLMLASCCLIACGGDGADTSTESETETDTEQVVSSLVIRGDKTEAQRGETVTLTALIKTGETETVIPSGVEYKIVEGADYATLSGNVLTIKNTANNGDTIKLTALVGATTSSELVITVKVPASTVLQPGEIVTEIQIPAPAAGVKTAFIKFAYRKSIDFPVVNCAVSVGGDEPRVCLNAVAPVPYRALKAEELLKGKEITEELAEAAGEAAVIGAQPDEDNRFKVQISKVMVKRALLSIK